MHEIKADKPIKELLEKNECYILNDDDLRIVYLWKGAEASVRSKFIGASKSQEVRGQVGMNYKCVPIDQDSEPTEFLEAIKKTPSKGFAKEIKEEMKLQFEVGGGPIKPRVTKLNTLNEDIQQSGPMFTGSSKSESPQSTSRAESAEPTKKEASKDVLNKIIETLDNERIPDGLEREMVIIGETAYSIAEKVKTFLGKKQVEKVLEPISTLPEGIFFAEGYTPRVVVKNQTVVAIEFLKKKE